VKILLVTPYFWPEIGAAPIRVSALAKVFVELGHKVTVVTGMPSYPEGATHTAYRGKLRLSETYEGVAVERRWFFPAKGSGFGRMANFASALFALFPPISKRYDLTIIESPPITNVFLIPLYKFRSKKVALFLADLWPEVLVDLKIIRAGGAVDRGLARLARWSYSTADEVAVATPEMAGIIALRQTRATKISTLRNGVDVNTFYPEVLSDAMDEELGVCGRKLFLYAGTLSLICGPEILLEVAKLCDPSKIVIGILGDGPLLNQMKAAKNSQSIVNLLFFGRVPADKVSSYYGNSYAGLSTLAPEASAGHIRPAKLLPALACGKPVIHSGSGPTVEVLNMYDCGVTVSAGNATEFASAITDAISNPRWKEMGTNAQKFAAENSWKQIAKVWLDGSMATSSEQRDRKRS
jgi:colanic acid biosynthesis glycosyl transferase WcaI